MPDRKDDPPGAPPDRIFVSNYVRELELGAFPDERGVTQRVRFSVDIDVSKIEVPSYFISAREDHIAPWKSTYAGARLFAGEVRYVLGGSGHIAGIVNPPVKNKYGYWTGSAAKLPESPDQWLEAAEEHEGSWWNDWNQWLIKHNGDKVPARKPGKGKFKALEDAPGSYVAKRI